jgi:hypothetical protein
LTHRKVHCRSRLWPNDFIFRLLTSDAQCRIYLEALRSAAA